jgi:hypothetical protein
MENEIWRRRVPKDRLEYWDQCGLIDPYRLLLAIFAIGKDELQLPWDNGLVADIEVKDGLVTRVKGKHLNIVDHISSDFISTVYHLLWIKCTRIHFNSPVKCHSCWSFYPAFMDPTNNLYFCNHLCQNKYYE